MENLLFELTNEQRKYFGLVPAEKHWELVKLNNIYLYFDGDIIRKEILADNDSYLERELCEKTVENKTILLPKTAKGKPKKLNYTATQSFSLFGVYVYFSLSNKFLSIANYTTQTTYFHEKFDREKNFENIKLWIKQWMADTSDKDLQEIESFRTAARQHCKFREGDFFSFKIGRRHWGFGRILIDVAKLRKTEEFKKQNNYGLANLMGKPLIVKVYHKISDTLNIDLDELKKCMALPSQAIMDNCFYYGEHKIIGHQNLTIGEYDMLISFSPINKNIVYLQYGFIYKEMNISKFNQYLKNKTLMSNFSINPYRNESIGFGLKIDNLKQCIESKSNNPFWNCDYYKWDLRNPKNAKIKKDIFSVFGLDPDKSYKENLEL